MAFYKKKINKNGIYMDLSTNTIVDIDIAENFVMSPDNELYKENHTEYIYPVEGWYWFDSIQKMVEDFNLLLVNDIIQDQ